eukprot:9303545-Pyramimonas_sp.AAC.1
MADRHRTQQYQYQRPPRNIGGPGVQCSWQQCSREVKPHYWKCLRGFGFGISESMRPQQGAHFRMYPSGQ